MRTTAILLALGAIGATLTAAPTASAAPPSYTVRPAELERGPDVKGPRIVGHQLVDGTRRVPVPGADAAYVGRAGGDYVVRSQDAAADVEGLWRVGTGGPVRLVEDLSYADVDVADDGTTVLVSTLERNQVALELRATSDGGLVRRSTIGGAFEVLDFDGRTAIVGGYNTARWDAATGRTTYLAPRRGGQAADIAADRVAIADSPDCVRVTTIRPPRRIVFRVCGSTVDAISPGGKRYLTSTSPDGVVQRSTLRDGRGRPLASYTIATGFYTVRWESPWVFVADAVGLGYAADVRCRPSGCERASALRRR